MPKVHVYRRDGESPNWHAQAYVGGKRYCFSCRTAHKPTLQTTAHSYCLSLHFSFGSNVAGKIE